MLATFLQMLTSALIGGVTGYLFGAKSMKDAERMNLKIKIIETLLKLKAELYDESKGSPVNPETRSLAEHANYFILAYANGFFFRKNRKREILSAWDSFYFQFCEKRFVKLYEAPTQHRDYAAYCEPLIAAVLKTIR